MYHDIIYDYERSAEAEAALVWEQSEGDESEKGEAAVPLSLQSDAPGQSVESENWKNTENFCFDMF